MTDNDPITDLLLGVVMYPAGDMLILLIVGLIKRGGCLSVRTCVHACANNLCSHNPLCVM